MLWIKAFHVVAMVCWFAGLFYLPRLFVYHAMSADSLSQERFVVMERKLYRGIMWPSSDRNLGAGNLAGGPRLGLLPHPKLAADQGFFGDRTDLLPLMVRIDQIKNDHRCRL